MRPILLHLLIALSATPASFLWGQADGEIAISKSGRFQSTVVNGALDTRLPTPNLPPPGTDWVSLEPRRVAVLFERVSDDCAALIGLAPAPTVAPTTIVIDSSLEPDTPIIGSATRFLNGWRFAIRTSERVERKHLINAAVDLTITQRVRTIPGPFEGRPPTWFTRGLAEYLLASATRPYYPEVSVNLTANAAAPLNTPMMPRVVDPQRYNPEEHARVLLAGQAALSWQSLSNPEIDFESAAQTARFDASAMLLVSRLLRTDERGPLRFRGFLSQINQYRNWPLAFRASFSDAFATPLEMEKWWAIQRRVFETRESYDLLQLGESAAQLRNLLTFGVGYRLQEEGDEPLEAVRFLSLAELARQASLRDQHGALSAARESLGILALQAAPEIALVTSEYASALDRYLEVIDSVFEGRLSVSQWRASRGRFVSQIEGIESTLNSIAPESRPDDVLLTPDDRSAQEAPEDSIVE